MLFAPVVCVERCDRVTRECRTDMCRNLAGMTFYGRPSLILLGLLSALVAGIAAIAAFRSDRGGES